ncbi:hypothetical protein Ancab_007843 [Ancistrocladus abbreviatus]
MFDFFFGWRKASKCKKLIKRVQCRLKLLKNKRYTIAKQLREDIGQLLKNGHEQVATGRLEQLYRDENIGAAYELLDHFCEFIILNLSYIRKHKDCPNDIKEAVSSLMFASARCGDLPELGEIRKLFGDRYGQRFATAAVQLLPGNLVSLQIKEKLTIRPVSDDVKYRLLDEIIRDCFFQPGPLALEYKPSPLMLKQPQVAESDDIQVLQRDVQVNRNKGIEPRIEVSEVGKANPSYNSKSLGQLLDHHQESNVTSNCISSPMLLQHLPPSKVLISKKATKMESHTPLAPPREHKNDGLGVVERNSPAKSPAANVVQAVKKSNSVYSSDSSSQFPHKTVIYLDDVEEFKNSIRKDVHCQDKRAFIFKPSLTSNREKTEHTRGFEETAGQRVSIGTKKLVRKKLRRRSASQEKRFMNDVECEIYYGGSYHNSHGQQKSQKKIYTQDSIRFACEGEGKRLHRCNEMRTGLQACDYSCNHFSSTAWDCSLDRPCYCCASDDEKYEIIQKRGAVNPVQCHVSRPEKSQDNLGQCFCFQEGEKIVEVDYIPLTQASGMEFASCTITDGNNNFQYDSPWTQSVGLDQLSHISSITDSPANRKALPAYLRALTMPQQHDKEINSTDIPRSNSSPLEAPNQLTKLTSSPSHVHPKLPDYDELAAKFMALKKAYQQSKLH